VAKLKDVIAGKVPREPTKRNPMRGPKKRRAVPKTAPIMQIRGLTGTMRPKSRISVELIEHFVENLSIGMTLENAAEEIGVHQSTLAEWNAKGLDPANAGTLFAAFSEAVARARALWRKAAVATITAGRRGWQGPAWLLERYDPKTYAAPPRRLEHSGAGGGSIKIVASSVEIPREIPDDHPSVRALSASSADANGKASPRGASDVATNGATVVLPEETDPE